MNEAYSQRVSVHPRPSALRRLARSMWRQSVSSPLCPDTPRLEGQVALVTGGSRGIGLETSRGLAARGTEVVTASRGEALGRGVAEELARAWAVPAHFVPLDLGDLRQLPRTLDHLEEVLEGRRLDVLVANAGLWPTQYSESAQGHEIAFATNVLGHHALLQGAIDRGLLAAAARIVVVTGDIYILSSECTSDYRYRGVLGGQLAYCRSKLGNLWYVRELARRHPSLRVHAVHPGVIASELSGSNSGLVGAAKRALMLSLERGAQTTLFCATQPGLESGSYYHNVFGRVELHPDDPGADDAKAEALWQLLERLA